MVLEEGFRADAVVLEVEGDEEEGFFGVEGAGDGVGEGGEVRRGEEVLLDAIGDAQAGFFPGVEEVFEFGGGVWGSGAFGDGVFGALAQEVAVVLDLGGLFGGAGREGFGGAGEGECDGAFEGDEVVEELDEGPFIGGEGGAGGLGVGAGEMDEPGFVFFHEGEGFGGGHG